MATKQYIPANGHFDPFSWLRDTNDQSKW